jgi:hypothetical protein
MWYTGIAFPETDREQPATEGERERTERLPATEGGHGDAHLSSRR